MGGYGMYPLIGQVSTELIRSVSRAITGKLYTEEQITTITSGAIGKYFAEFFPTPKEELETHERVGSARKHISAASSIISDMQQDLETQDRKLSELLKEVEQKKQLADRYQALANTNREAFDAFRAEMEDALRKELEEQAVKGRRIRQAVSVILWVLTLVAGAALGAYFKDIITFVKSSI
jgi:CHASE3 domain sensor protein